jgi:hypothetical protein
LNTFFEWTADRPFFGFLDLVLCWCFGLVFMLWLFLEACGRLLKTLGHWRLFIDFVCHSKEFKAWQASRKREADE